MWMTLSAPCWLMLLRWTCLACMHDGMPVPPLLYADDLVLLSTSPEGLQKQLDASIACVQLFLGADCECRQNKGGGLWPPPFCC